MSATNPVRQLNAETARKIAAGEVIDRPNAIVRELMDNAIDSGASNITVEITGGGIEKVRIVDNGCGMTKDDLFSCARPHATSKISNENDLLNLTTLGFRGEALSSIAAVCRLSIISGGYKMRSSITEDHIIEQTAYLEGTIVQSEGLFENFPARRMFLKRPASEGTMCKNTFIEKCLPCPEKSFRFISDGDIKLDLPQGQSLKERFVKAMELKESPSLFYEISGHSQIADSSDWSFKIVIGEPGVFRSNKKDILIFVNGRKITEYSLVQAIEYGGQGYFPNGTFPVAAAFININPAFVDFNIHPAKKEARFKDISSLHHAISTTVKSFFASYTNKTMKIGLRSYEEKPNLVLREKYISSSIPSWKPNAKISERYTISHTSQKDSFSKSNFSNEKNDKKESKAQKIKAATELLDMAIAAYNGVEIPSAPTEQLVQEALSNEVVDSQTKPEQNPQENQNSPFHFLGSALGTFLIAEKGNTLYIIDKHAADERYIFDQIMKNQEKRQNLLLPYVVETKNQDEDNYLESIKLELSKIGFDCENKGSGRWEFSSLNERWKGSEIELAHDLLDKKVSPKDLIYSIAAMTACKAAVKDGWTLLDSTAEEVAKRALELEDPHCPHGRPVYTTLTREKLFELVRRT